MDKCHKYVAKLAPTLIQNKHAFEHHDKNAIKQELNDIIERIQHIIHSTNTIASLRNVLDAQFPISEMFREFFYVIHTYLSEPICHKGDRDYTNIIRNYLCADGAKNLVTLYHFIANVGIIESGCTRIYLVDRTKRGTQADIIDDESVFLQNILNPSFRISKSAVERVAINDMHKLLVARTLLAISKDFRSNIEDFCPKIYKNWTIENKRQHEQFEQYLSELIRTIDHVVNEHRQNYF